MLESPNALNSHEVSVLVIGTFEFISSLELRISSLNLFTLQAVKFIESRCCNWSTYALDSA